MDTGSEYGAEYVAWKQWGGEFGKVGHDERAYFSAEIARTGLTDINEVLDIGFGNGSFLGFANSRGWRAMGTEVNAELLRMASSEGFEVLTGNQSDILPDRHFDLITAFDVLEHIPESELVGLLSTLRSKLRPGGILLARFPNGDSPLGLAYQYGDVTHVTVLGRLKAAYLAQMCSLELAYIRGQAEPILCGSWIHVLRRLLVVPIKAIAERALRIVFFPEVQRGFLSPNLVVAFRRAAD